MKKLISIILTLTLVVTMVATLAACNTKTPPNFDVPEGGYDGSNVTLTFYHTMGQNYQKILDDYIIEFNELYPNITVEHSQIGGYDEVRKQIQTEVGNGQGPNIAYCYADHVALYNRSNVVAHLDNLIDSEIADGDGILGLTDKQKEDFIESYYNEGAGFGDDHMYMLPFSKSTELMYYNKDFFAANKLELPDHWFATDGKQGTASSDHTSMEYVIAKIKEIDSTCIPLGYDSEANWFITLTEQFDTPYTSSTGEHYRFNTDENREMVNTLRRWYQAGYITTKALNNDAYCSGIFKTQKSYICIGFSAGAAQQRPDKDTAGQYPFDVGITTIPQAKASTKTEDSKVISQGPSVCIFKKDNPQEVVASWLFVKYLLTSVPFQAEFAMVGGYNPVIKSAIENPVYANLLKNGDGGDNIAGLAARICMDQADAYFTSPVFYGSSNARDEVGKLMQTCLIIKNTDSDIKGKILDAFKYAISECKYAA